VQTLFDREGIRDEPVLPHLVDIVLVDCHLSYPYRDGTPALMRAIKGAIDPENLMNPGKMLPPG
jgi:hypothetical protein